MENIILVNYICVNARPNLKRSLIYIYMRVSFDYSDTVTVIFNQCEIDD